MSSFIRSGFSDEVSSDTTVQFEALNRLGIKHFEPRRIDGKTYLSSDVFLTLQILFNADKKPILTRMKC